MLVLLEAQERGLWDQGLIRRGQWSCWSARRRATDVSEFHLEAAIAAKHSLAPRYEETDWAASSGSTICCSGVKPTPIVALNRAIAVGQVDGPEAGLGSRSHAIPAGGARRGTPSSRRPPWERCTAEQADLPGGRGALPDGPRHTRGARPRPRSSGSGSFRVAV
jgi:hypothetical protein